jgi:hypothetical protein
MKLLAFITILCFFFSSNTGIAQTPQSQKTDVNKDIDPLKVFERYVQDGYGTPSVYKKLANGYYFKNEYPAAKKWFEKLFQSDQPISQTYKARYIQTLRALKIDATNNPYITKVSSN